MTEFSTAIGESKYYLTFETDSREHYLHMEAEARKCVDGHHRCSVCQGLPREFNGEQRGLKFNVLFGGYQYCPFCGEKIDGGVDNDV